MISAYFQKLYFVMEWEFCNPKGKLVKFAGKLDLNKQDLEFKEKPN